MPEARPAQIVTFVDRLVTVEPGEWPRLAVAFFYFFFLLGGYFMLRPVRGTIAANNSEILHWLYTGTFLTMLAIVSAAIAPLSPDETQHHPVVR